MGTNESFLDLVSYSVENACYRISEMVQAIKIWKSPIAALRQANIDIMNGMSEFYTKMK